MSSLTLKCLESHPRSPVRQAARAALDRCTADMGKEVAENTPLPDLLAQLQASPEQNAEVIELLRHAQQQEQAGTAGLPLEPTETISTHLENTLLTDIKEETLRTVISEDLNTAFLSAATGQPSFPVHGYLYGMFMRPFVNLIVQARAGRGQPINVFFLVDTGAADTFLSTTTLTALGFTENTPSQARVSIHGRQVTACHSPPESHFGGINLLGASFLVAANARVELDYHGARKTVNITAY